MVIEATDLYCTENGSDKVYQLSVEGEGGAYNVHTAYGRRGSTLNYGIKNPTPLTLEQATKMYLKIISEKTAKGYKSLNAVNPIPTLTSKADSGWRPQLLNTITEDQLEKYIIDDDWGFQEKMDGERRGINQRPSRVTVGMNKKGQVVPLEKAIMNYMANVPHYFTIDGELVGDVYYAFDITSKDQLDICNSDYAYRYSVLMELLYMASDNVKVVPLCRTEDQKRKLLALVKEKGGEGLVVKNLRAVYTEGRPNSGGNQLKFKFWESCTCLVNEVNDKRSVRIGMRDDLGPVPVGNVTIPANHSIPGPGHYIEVKYLYYYPGGSLFQPQYIGERTDVDWEDCHIKQLKVTTK